jgi:hypothetical protein
VRQKTRLVANLTELTLRYTEARTDFLLGDPVSSIKQEGFNLCALIHVHPLSGADVSLRAASATRSLVGVNNSISSTTVFAIISARA